MHVINVFMNMLSLGITLSYRLQLFIFIKFQVKEERKGSDIANGQYTQNNVTDYLSCNYRCVIHNNQ